MFERRLHNAEAKAHAKIMSALLRAKLRLVVDLIRGKQVGEAIAILRHTPKAASPVVEKLLNSAIANAEHNYSIGCEQIGDLASLCQPRTDDETFPPARNGTRKPD